MNDAIEARLGELAGTVERLRSLLRKQGDSLPGILLAKMVVDADKAANRLHRHAEDLEKTGEKQ